MPKNTGTLDPDAVVPTDENSKAFVDGLLKRGEAASPSQDGSIAPGVTHLIVGQTDGGRPILKRIRFSAF